MTAVLVLNAGYEPLHYVDLHKAIKHLVNKKAVIEETVEGVFFGAFPMPVSIRLVRYVNMHWRKGKPKYSKKRLFQRDNYKCAYCNGPANTKDHVKPDSRGGETDWLNLVAACFPCNNRKNNRTPQEAGMKLLWQPFEPRWQDLYAEGLTGY